MTMLREEWEAAVRPVAPRQGLVRLLPEQCPQWNRPGPVPDLVQPESTEKHSVAVAFTSSQWEDDLADRDRTVGQYLCNG